MILQGITSIRVRSRDTDVLVILLSFMPQFIELNDSVKVWLDFGMGDNRIIYFVNRAYSDLGESVCLALPFSTHQQDVTLRKLSSKSLRTVFEHWTKYDKVDEITWAFQQLSWLPTV